MTYIESDQDLTGLKYCSSANNDFIVKLTIMRSNKLNEKLMETMMEELVTINMQ